MPTTPRHPIFGAEWTRVQHARWLHEVAAQLDFLQAYDPALRTTRVGQDLERAADELRSLAADLLPSDSEASLPF